MAGYVRGRRRPAQRPPPEGASVAYALNQEPAGARVAGLGDRAPALGLARAVLAGHEAEVGFELMREAEALGVVDRGDEGGGGDGADAGDGAQARHARVLDGEVLDRGVGVRELPVEGAHEGKQRRDHREQAAGQGQAPAAMDKALRTAGRDAVAVLPEQGPDERDLARARPDHGVPDQQPAPHGPLGVGEAMGRAVGAEQARLGQGPGIPSVGLHLAGPPRRIHRREVRVRDDDLVAEGLETPGHPFDSLSVEASITIRAQGRVPSTAAKRSGSVRMRCSTISPPSARM
jgi:hypothetical protein